ncbi:MAG: DUF2335 domain-containing protein [Nannocystaceae bacterium]
MPHPSILEAYARVSGAAELVLEMARAEQRHRHEMEARRRQLDELALDAQATDNAEEWALWRRGQVVGACVVAFIALVGTIGTVLLAYLGANAWVTGLSSLIPVGSVVAIVRTWMLDGKSKREREHPGGARSIPATAEEDARAGEARDVRAPRADEPRAVAARGGEADVGAAPVGRSTGVDAAAATPAPRP